MKRNELKVGETYAVLAPSQKVSGGRYGFSASAKKVIVVDTEAKWGQVYRGWRHESKPATVIIDGTTYAVEDDLTIESKSDYRDSEAKRSVKVLVVDETSYSARQAKKTLYELDVVPLSQVRYTWAEYEVERDAAEAERVRIANARDRAYREKTAEEEKDRANRDALNEVLEGTDLTARILDGEVVLAGPLDVLRAIIETANDQSFTTKEEAGVR